MTKERMLQILAECGYSQELARDICEDPKALAGVEEEVFRKNAVAILRRAARLSQSKASV